MKSKKLFAILTLVAFMMTLVPAMAFGVGYSATGSKVIDVDKEVLKVGKTATISVEFRDTDRNLLVETPIDDFYVKTSKDGVKVYPLSPDNGNRLSQLDFDGTATFGIAVASGLKTNDDGIIEFEVTSDYAEEFTISFWNSFQAADDELSIGCLGEATITFTSSSASIDRVTISAPTAADAGDEIKLVARVYDAQNNGLADKTVTFYKSESATGGFSSIGTATTNNLGKAEFEYDETEAGKFYYKAKCGSEEVVSAVCNVDAGDPVKVEAITADGKVFDVDKVENEVRFAITDNFGNRIVNKTALTISITSAPEDSDLEGEDYTGEELFEDAEEEEVYAKITFDEVGDYTIKAKLNGVGIFTTIDVSAMEAGDAEEITVDFVEDAARSLIAGEYTVDGETVGDRLTLEVNYVDVNGIEFAADDFKAYTSDVSLVKIHDVDTANGEIVVEGPTDDTKRGVATITVVDLGTGATASIDVPVVGQPYALDVDYTVSGKTAKVTLQYVDDEGSVTASGSDDDYEILYPDAVSISSKKVFDEDAGFATFEATVDEYGTYQLTVVTDDGIAKQFEIVVGEPAEEKTSEGSVTMFIGSTGYVVNGVPMISDVAPFIKDGRTFVAVRPLANAFGVAPENIGWDEVTGTVTLTRDDITVTIVIGSNDIEVVQDGVISTVTADVPAFIENGRTVLPFRAVGEAFGATVSWDEATQSVTYEL